MTLTDEQVAERRKAMDTWVESGIEGVRLRPPVHCDRVGCKRRIDPVGEAVWTDEGLVCRIHISDEQWKLCRWPADERKDAPDLRSR